MDRRKVFLCENGKGMKIYIQQNTPQLKERAEVLRARIERNGGHCLEKPEEATVIVIIDAGSPSGKRLIRTYSVEDPEVQDGRGVVRETWVMDCIENGTRYDDDPHWGGHYLKHPKESVEPLVPNPMPVPPGPSRSSRNLLPSKSIALLIRDATASLGNPRAQTAPPAKLAERQRQSSGLPTAVAPSSKTSRPLSALKQSVASASHSQHSPVRPLRETRQLSPDTNSSVSEDLEPEIVTTTRKRAELNSRITSQFMTSRRIAMSSPVAGPSNSSKRPASGYEDRNRDDSRPHKVARKNAPFNPSTLSLGSLPRETDVIHGNVGAPYTESETRALVEFIASNQDAFWAGRPDPSIWDAFADEIGSKRSGDGWRKYYAKNEEGLKRKADKLSVRASKNLMFGL